jgi:hypothetical protein
MCRSLWATSSSNPPLTTSERGTRSVMIRSVLCWRPYAWSWPTRALPRWAITVNASYYPGIAGTAMPDLIDEELAKHMRLQKGEALKQYSELLALGRVEVPEDVAAFVW